MIFNSPDATGLLNLHVEQSKFYMSREMSPRARGREASAIVAQEASLMAMDYSEYLMLDQLLDLQRPRSDVHDETLFIVVHQVHELWFKVVLSEADALGQALGGNDGAGALAAARKMTSIIDSLADQMELMSTMSPVAFASFRGELGTSSGFQSAQFRELEIVLGRRDGEVLRHHPEGSPARRRLEQRMEADSLRARFLGWLASNGHVVDAGDDPGGPAARALLEIYRNRPREMEICEALVELDRSLQQWRYRHVKVVERFIGTGRGTGGSAGASFLRETLFKPAFPELWTMRGDM